jgi:acetyl esterase/lipase
MSGLAQHILQPLALGGEIRRIDNVSGFLAAHGMVGVTINYRLAPPVSYPAEHQDIAAMVAWLRAHAAEYGGDGAKIP